MKLPLPGTDAAIAAGCRCPVLDNNHGAGAYQDDQGPHYWINGECPIHARPSAPPPDPEIECPACGEAVKQVASATLSLALWQHWNWTCPKGRQSAPPEGEQGEPTEQERLRAYIDKTAAEVESWPDWMKAGPNKRHQ